ELEEHLRGWQAKLALVEEEHATLRSKMDRARAHTLHSEDTQKAAPATEVKQDLQKSSPVAEVCQNASKATFVTEANQDTQKTMSVPEVDVATQKAAPVTNYSQHMQKATPVVDGNREVESRRLAGDLMEAVETSIKRRPASALSISLSLSIALCGLPGSSGLPPSRGCGRACGTAALCCARWPWPRSPTSPSCRSTRVQDVHVEDAESNLLSIFDAAVPSAAPHGVAWAVSTARKGYSGTCAIYSRRAGGGIVHSAGGEVNAADRAEGRTVRLDLACGLSVVGAYVPNAGAGLKRLEFRVREWDEDLRSYLRRLGAERPVLLCGDLNNVAHEDLDFWNPGEPRTKKQAGTSPEERASFGRTLGELDLVDAFRWRHPDAEGVFTYWSQRSRSRGANRGMRLDYFLGSRGLFGPPGGGARSAVAVHDCAVLDAFGGSDHCPISCTLRTAPSAASAAETAG
ncbi:unnamed protein product, partial [Prorocentrum cordatum]